jgi:phage baseplate assembly protein W
MTYVAFPFTVDGRGRTGEAGLARHIADLVEAVLFTAPGERVNRPDFGSGLAQLLFAPVDESVVSAAELHARSGLQRWLGEAVDIEDLSVELADAAVRVTVRYRLRASGTSTAVSFERTT